jgi:hypothetical protein
LEAGAKMHLSVGAPRHTSLDRRAILLRDLFVVAVFKNETCLPEWPGKDVDYYFTLAAINLFALDNSGSELLIGGNNEPLKPEVRV